MEELYERWFSCRLSMLTCLDVFTNTCVGCSFSTCNVSVFALIGGIKLVYMSVVFLGF